MSECTCDRESCHPCPVVVEEWEADLIPLDTLPANPPTAA